MFKSGSNWQDEARGHRPSRECGAHALHFDDVRARCFGRNVDGMRSWRVSVSCFTKGCRAWPAVELPREPADDCARRRRTRRVSDNTRHDVTLPGESHSSRFLWSTTVEWSRQTPAEGEAGGIGLLSFQGLSQRIGRRQRWGRQTGAGASKIKMSMVMDQANDTEIQRSSSGRPFERRGPYLRRRTSLWRVSCRLEPGLASFHFTVEVFWCSNEDESQTLEGKAKATRRDENRVQVSWGRTKNLVHTINFIYASCEPFRTIGSRSRLARQGPGFVGGLCD